MWTGTTISAQIAPSASGTTYRQDSYHDRLEDMGLLGQTTDVAVVDLVNPQRGRRANEEQRELDRDGEHQDRVVDTVDRARRADTFECLPAERLPRVVSMTTQSPSELLAYLHEPPAEERGDEQGEAVEGQARDFGVVTVLPVVGKQIDATGALGGEGGKLLVEYLCVRLDVREQHDY